METDISKIILKIGEDYKQKYGEKYDITLELICNIYMWQDQRENNGFTFLNTFMDSELDCDKMDYLLRDSLYCGVNYGKYDIEHLISSFAVYIQEGIPRLAITQGGIQAFEEFMLARYFMLVQVYFHRTRRYFDIQLQSALKHILPKGQYPENTKEYLEWNDCRILELLRENSNKNEACKNIISRKVYPTILETKTHPSECDKKMHAKASVELIRKWGRSNFIIDNAADKMPHKIPIKTTGEDENAWFVNSFLAV